MGLKQRAPSSCRPPRPYHCCFSCFSFSKKTVKPQLPDRKRRRCGSASVRAKLPRPSPWAQPASLCPLRQPARRPREKASRLSWPLLRQAPGGGSYHHPQKGGSCNRLKRSGGERGGRGFQAFPQAWQEARNMRSCPRFESCKDQAAGRGLAGQRDSVPGLGFDAGQPTLCTTGASPMSQPGNRSKWRDPLFHRSPNPLPDHRPSRFVSVAPADPFSSCPSWAFTGRQSCTFGGGHPLLVDVEQCCPLLAGSKQVWLHLAFPPLPI